MNTGILDFNHGTVHDACKIASKMFSPGISAHIEHILSNPVNVTAGFDSYGDVAYQEGAPVAFRAAILRNMYFKQEPLLGVVGSTFCSASDTSPVLLLKLLKKNVGDRCGNTLFFTNTSCEASMRLNKLVGVKFMGPDSCACIRFFVFRFGELINVLLRGKCPHIISACIDAVGLFLMRVLRVLPSRMDQYVSQNTEIAGGRYEAFWNEYVKNNVGLVCSRTVRELQWAFRDGLRSGKYILLEYSDPEKGLLGYIVLKRRSKERWGIADWIALDDNPKILGALLKGALACLVQNKDVVLLELIGYPLFVAKLIGKVLPFKRRAQYNTFSYRIVDADREAEIVADLSKSWFFGSYDGDRFM